MRILLVCAGGWSTGLLVASMKEAGSEEDVIEARAISDLENLINDFDVVLLGPQVGYKFGSVSALCEKEGKACARIDMTAYGRLQGDVVYNQAKELFESLQK